MLDTASVRQQFPAVQKTVYFNTGFDGPSPLPVLRAMQQRLELETMEGPTTQHVQEAGRELTTKAKAAIAGMVNVSPDEIHLTQNTMEGLNIILNGVQWKPGDELITVSIEYPSVMVLALHIQRRYGVKVRIVEISPTEASQSIVAKIGEAVNPRTRMIFLSHVHFLNGMRMPGEEISSIAHRNGVQVLLDGAQGPGNVVLDLHGMGVDFYSMPGQKWICGPDGIGALYVRKDNIAGLLPAYAAARAAKSWLPTGEWVPEDESIAKFQLTTSNAAIRAGYVEAINYLQSVGLTNIQDHNTQLATAMKRALRTIPNVTLHSPDAPPAATSMVTFGIEGKAPRDIVNALWQDKKVVCRTIEPLHGVRLSLHLFNTEQEVAMVADEIRKMAR